MTISKLRKFFVLALLSTTALSFAAAPKAAPKHHKFSASQASGIALKKFPGTVVGKVELENEEGKWQYAVNIRSKKGLREVMVGADSGKVESSEVTTPKEEAREKAAENKKKHGG